MSGSLIRRPGGTVLEGLAARDVVGQVVPVVAVVACRLRRDDHRVLPLSCRRCPAATRGRSGLMREVIFKVRHGFRLAAANV